MNELKLSLQQSILALSKGHSARWIARQLGINRETVAKYLRAAAKPVNGDHGEPVPKPAISTSGSDAAKPAISALSSEDGVNSKPAISTSGAAAGRRSLCEEWQTEIELALDAELSAQRIYQDLVAEHQFGGSYQSVKRFVRRLGQARPLPFRRMECEPGHEVQVDFGQGAWVIENGKRRRPHLFRVVLSHSRKAYSEVVWQQTSENFIRCLENAFRYFGGVPRTCVIDNLRAAVTKADWFDPQLNPKVVSFAEHYQTVILPAKPYMPRHKGKVESGVKYVQNNALKGRSFGSLAEQNKFLLDWESGVADTRIHGTTRMQVGCIFEKVEKPALLALPQSLFPVFCEAPRMVHQDGHVEVAQTYYSVPPEYVGRKVWARWEPRLVRIFNTRMEQIALHARQQPGRFSTDPIHIHSRKRCAVENGLDWLLDRARIIGPHSASWAETMVKNRGIEGIRVLQGFLQLAAKHTPVNVEAASQLACAHGVWRLHEIKSLLANPRAQEQFEFVQEHPLIRNLSHYQALIPDCFSHQSQSEKEPIETHHESSDPQSNP
jgi:transposase